MSLRITRSKTLNTIPERKVLAALEETLKKCKICSKTGKLDAACIDCRTVNSALMRYRDSNIPSSFWMLGMNDFKGDKVLLEKYNRIVENLSEVYKKGICICFAGSHGRGKTLVSTNILKRAAEKGFQCLYTTLSDIVAATVNGPPEDKYNIRRELLMIDFLVIDEFDPRWIPSGASSDLFGRRLEEILRKRVENNLPIFMCTNSPSVIDTFDGSIRSGIDSLMNYAEFITVLGSDFRRGMNEQS